MNRNDTFSRGPNQQTKSNSNPSPCPSLYPCHLIQWCRNAERIIADQERLNTTIVGQEPHPNAPPDQREGIMRVPDRTDVTPTFEDEEDGELNSDEEMMHAVIRGNFVVFVRSCEDYRYRDIPNFAKRRQRSMLTTTSCKSAPDRDNDGATVRALL